MPFLVVMPCPQPTIILPVYASLNSDTAWRLVPGGVLLPWSATEAYPISVPLANAGPGFVDAGGRFWLYAQFQTVSGFTLTGTYGATYDFVTETAVPEWTVSGAPIGTGGIASAIDDGGAGFYAVAPGGPNWIVAYSGTGGSATATTTSDPAWATAWDLGSPPALPFYANGQVWALWRQAGAIYGLVMGEYNATWTSGGHEFVASLWTCGAGDPTDVSAWSFVQYLAHFDLSTGSTYWGDLGEQLLPWRMPVALGTDMFFPTGLNIIEGGPSTPFDTTAVWRMDNTGAVTADLAMPLPATGLETWGGPLAVYGGDLYWAQFTHPYPGNWATESGTLTLWKRTSGTWAVVSTWTRPLLNTVYHPLIATMVAAPTGLWLLFAPADNWFTGSADPTPTIWVWDAISNTWSTGATISGGGGNMTPRIWTPPP